MSNARNLAKLSVDSNGDVAAASLDNVVGLPDAIDVNASAPADSLAISSSGNVGIGTSSPTSKLHVSGGSGTNIGIQASTGRHWRLGDGVGSTDGNFVIYDYTGSAKRLELDTSGNLLFNSGYGSVATAYGCRAWVNFNGQGTVAIRASGNVSSITDNGTGDYYVNFTTAMPDTNYVITGSARIQDSTSADGAVFGTTRQNVSTIYQTDKCRVNAVWPHDGSLYDAAAMSVAIFR